MDNLILCCCDLHCTTNQFLRYVIPQTYAWSQNYARYLVPFLDNTRHISFRMSELFTFFNNRWFSVQILFGRNTKRSWWRSLRTPLISTARWEEATSGWTLILPRKRDGCLLTQGVGYRKLLRPALFVYYFLPDLPRYKELATTRIKEGTKAVGKLVDVLEDVITNPWKEDVGIRYPK